MTDMHTTMRSHAAGALRLPDEGAEVALCGWVARRRDHGGVTFIDLRDREGAVQLVFHPEEAAETHAAAQSLGGEDVIALRLVVGGCRRAVGQWRSGCRAGGSGRVRRWVRRRVRR